MKERKIIIALRRYWLYLKMRTVYINSGFLNVSDKEFKRISKTMDMYYLAFYTHTGFMDWLIKKDFSHVSYIPIEGKERFYFNIADKLKNDILEAEK